MALVVENKDVHFASVKWAYRVGSIDEKENEHGSCHFIEHLFFKFRNQNNVNLATLIEKCGGTVNATTSHEKMIIHIQCPTESLSAILEFLHKMHKDFSFGLDDFNDEKNIILEEITRLEDRPSSRCGRAIFENFFKGSPYAHPILGSKKDIESIDYETVVQFHKRLFIDDHLLVSIVKSEKTFVPNLDDQKNKVAQRQALSMQMNNSTHPQLTFISVDDEDAKAFLVFRAPKNFSKKAAHLELWTYLLTKDENAPLSRLCMSKDNLIRGLNLHLQPFEEESMLEFSVCYHPGRLAEVYDRIETAMSQIKISKMELAFSARLIEKQSEEEKQDNDIICMKNLQKLYLADDKLEEKYLNYITEASCSDLEKSLVDTFSLPPKSIVIESSSELDKLKPKQWRVATEWLSEPLPELVLENKTSGSCLVDFFIQAENTKLVYVTGSSLGGNLLEYATNYPPDTFHLLSQSLFQRSAINGSQLVSHHLDKLGAQFSGFSGKDSFGFCATFFEQDLSAVQDLMTELIHNPKIEKSYLDKLIQSKKIERRFLEKEPKKWALTRSRELYYGDHPYGYREPINDLSADELLAFYQEYLREHADFSLCAASQSPINEIMIGGLPRSGYRIDARQFTGKYCENVQENFNCEQVHIVYLYPGAQWNTLAQVMIDTVCEIMAGQSGLLFETFREKYPICYEVAPICSHGYAEGVFGFYFATKRPNVDLLKNVLAEIIKGFDQFLTEKTLESARSSILFEEQIQKQFLFERVMSASLMHTYGEQKNPLGLYVENLSRVSLGSLKNFTNKIFSQEPFIFELGPLN